MEQSHMHKTDKTGNKRIWLFVALGVLLLLSVFRALGFVTEALALEQQPRCGMTEHLHTESCYINDVLVCRQKAHTHSDSCYPLLLADNDINQLLTQIASTRDRSLESLLRSGNVRGILVLNKDLRVQTTQEDNAEADYPWIGGVGLLDVNDTPSTASNAINFYIRLDGNITCIGSKTLTTSRNIRQLSKTNAVSAYTAVVEASLTTGNLQSSYYLRYNTTGSTTSFSSTAGASGSNLTFGNGSSARYALLTSRSGNTYTPIDFYTLTLDYSAAVGGSSFYYVESGLGYTLPTLNGYHWEDGDGNTVTTVTITRPTTVYARPDACTVIYYVDGMEYARDENLRPNTAYTLRDVPDGWEGWRGDDGTVRKTGTQMTLTGSMTFHAVKYVTVTFRHLDGSTSTQQVLQGDQLTLPGGYWSDEAGTAYTGGSAVTINGDATFIQTSGPPLTVTYTVNWATPSGLNAPATIPNIVGASSYTVAADGSHMVSRVSGRTVTCAFTNVTNRYGSVYFAGWQTETGEIILPDAQLTWDELKLYDADNDGVTSLTGLWKYHMLQSVNFFVKLNSAHSSGETGSEYYTPVIFTTYVGGIDSEIGSGASSGYVDALNEKYAVEMTADTTYLANDRLIRAMFGSDTAPWLAELPHDNDIFQQLKAYVQDGGQLSVPNEAGEFVTVDVNDLNEYGYAIRWYAFKACSDGGNVYDWHVDGVLVRKEGRVHTTKTFSGNETLIHQARDGFFIHAVNEAQDTRYIMTITDPTDDERAAILDRLGLSASQITGWLTPIDDGDGNDNTLLWEFRDVEYDEAWVITEYPPQVAESADYAEWVVVDSSASNQSASGIGGTVEIRGVTHATDLEDPEWLRAEFNNIYFRGNSLMLKKEDAATGQALSGARFQLYQGDTLMTFDYDTETGLYIFDSHGSGAVDTLVCDGYTNLSTSGFAYDMGDITVREVTAPEGYGAVGDVTIGYTQDTDGDGVPDSTIGITNSADSGAYARYDSGLLVIRNSSAPTRVTAVKRWNCADSEREDVVMQLLANGSANTAAAILQSSGQSATVTLTAVDGWVYTWYDLPVYANGAPVTWTIRELRVGSENCKSDYSFPNWIVTYRSQTTADGLVLTAENTPKRPMLYLDKWDMTGRQRLAGAIFSLIPVDDDGVPLSGAVSKTAVTGADGSLRFDNLRHNTRYRLTELQAPEGYIPYDTPAYLTLGEDGRVTVEAHGYVSAAATAFHISVVNRSADSLPDTGGSGLNGYYAAGAALALSALCAAILSRRRRGAGSNG